MEDWRGRDVRGVKQAWRVRADAPSRALALHVDFGMCVAGLKDWNISGSTAFVKAGARSEGWNEARGG